MIYVFTDVMLFNITTQLEPIYVWLFFLSDEAIFFISLKDFFSQAYQA